MTCPHCGKPATRLEDGTLVHVGGPADGSFICHFEGDPACDCWACEARRT